MRSAFLSFLKSHVCELIRTFHVKSMYAWISNDRLVVIIITNIEFIFSDDPAMNEGRIQEFSNEAVRQQIKSSTLRVVF